MKKLIARFGLLALLTSCAASLVGGYRMEAYDLYGNLIEEKNGVDVGVFDIQTTHQSICRRHPNATIITRDLVSNAEIRDGRSPYHCVRY